MYHVLSPVYPVYPHTIASHIFVYMYVCMSVCLSVCMYACMHGCNVCMHGWMYVWMDGCMYLCMYVRTCVRMYVCTACMHACMHHPVLVTSVLSSFIIHRGVLKMVDPQNSMAFNTKMVIQDWMKRGYPP